MRRLAFVLVALAAPGAAGLLAQPKPQDGADSEKQLRAVIAGYRANRDSFPYFTCKYTVTIGQARTVDDARAGKILNPIVTHATWLVDGAKVLHTTSAPPDLVEKAAKDAKPDKNGRVAVTVPAVSMGFLAAGGYQLRHSPAMRGAGLHTPDAPTIGVDETPFGMGAMGADEAVNPGVELQRCDNGTHYFELIGMGETDHLPTFTVGFAEKGKKLTHQYTFDLSHGFLPRRIELTHPDLGKKLATAYLTHVRKCSKDRWFPERSVDVNTPAVADQPMFVREIKVLELDADNRPKAADFALALPAKTRVTNADVSSWIDLQQPERVTPDDLPRLAQLLQQAKERKPMTTALAPPRRARWPYWAGGAALCLAALGLIVFRSRR